MQYKLWWGGFYARVNIHQHCSSAGTRGVDGGRGGRRPVRSYCANKTDAIVEIIIGNRLVIPYVRVPVLSIIIIIIIFLFFFFHYCCVFQPPGYYFIRRKFRGNTTRSQYCFPTDIGLLWVRHIMSYVFVCVYVCARLCVQFICILLKSRN